MSRLTEAQSWEVFALHGSWIRDICDACGRPLGNEQFTIHGDPRTWCSYECRGPFLPPEWRAVKTERKKPAEIAEGVCDRKGCLECGMSLEGKRADSEFCSDTHRKRFRARRPQ
jgi:hypothetical protein